MGQFDREQPLRCPRAGLREMGSRPRLTGARRASVVAAAAVLLGASLAAPAVAIEPGTGPGSMQNRRVVQKENNFTLHIEDRVVDRGRVIHIYRVEQVNGPWLWIRSESNGFRGWALADRVVPVEEGISFFSRQIEANPGDVFSFMMRAVLWQDRREIDRALSDFDAALRIDPDEAWVFNNRGILHFERNDYEKALADFDAALRLEPTNSNVYNNRGSVRRATRLYDLAIADFSEAIRLSPNYEYAFFNRGLAWADKKDYDRAIADFNEVVRLDATDPLTYYHRGLAWSGKGEHARAIDDFTRSLQHGGMMAFVYTDRGRERAATKDYPGAIRDFDRALRLDPTNARILYWRGLARVEGGEFDRALADYDQAIRLDPGFDEVYLSRAWILASCPNTRLRDPKKAVESATRACELTHWHEAHDIGGLAAVYAETGNVAAALKWHSKAIELMTASGTLASDHAPFSHQ